ncbi:MAG: hypothetical protein KIT14_10275 [bacterium]|nr:hypothetical protein [bacterium]
MRLPRTDVVLPLTPARQKHASGWLHAALNVSCRLQPAPGTMTHEPVPVQPRDELPNAAAVSTSSIQK